MATSFNETVQKARALAAGRTMLAKTLLDSLQAPLSGIETARAQEIEKRVPAFDCGETPAYGAEDVFAAAVEDATVRTLAFPLAGPPATKNIGPVFLKDFPFAVAYQPDAIGSRSLRSRTVRVGQATGNRVLRTANKSLQPTGYAGG